MIFKIKRDKKILTHLFYITIFSIYTINVFGYTDKIKVVYDKYNDIIGIYNIEIISDGRDGCYFEKNIKGSLKKIEYYDNEIDIKGIVIEIDFGTRTYINIDGEKFKDLSNVDRGNLHTLFKKDQILEIDCNVCGNGAGFLYAVNIIKLE